MKEITILSGKGGTGKTSVTAAMASLAGKSVFCDNDVDAADLHMLMNPEIKEEHLFHGAYVAKINQDICTGCGLCTDYCRFDAITVIDQNYSVNPFKCEGCRLCERICPEKAIRSERSNNNRWFVSDTRFGTLVHARMGAGEENSGKLVTEVRKKSREIAEATGALYIINDGPPGIGCAAISSVTGTDHVLIVAEPTMSGLHDARRLVNLINEFGITTSAIINKADLNPAITQMTVQFFREQEVPVIGTLDFDQDFVYAMIKGLNIIEYAPESAASHALKAAWNEISS